MKIGDKVKLSNGVANDIALELDSSDEINWYLIGALAYLKGDDPVGTISSLIEEKEDITPRVSPDPPYFLVTWDEAKGTSDWLEFFNNQLSDYRWYETDLVLQ
jgi:hypothetical protein